MLDDLSYSKSRMGVMNHVDLMLVDHMKNYYLSKNPELVYNAAEAKRWVSSTALRYQRYRSIKLRELREDVGRRRQLFRALARHYKGECS